MSSSVFEERPQPEPGFAEVGRWIFGHQTFHIQLVTMLSVLDHGQQSLALDDWPRLVSALEDLRTLVDASTANMVYTASFSPDLYADAVRPSMMPPYLSPGFSGQLSQEHYLMLEEFGRLKLALKGRWGDEPWPAEVTRAWKQIEKSVQRNRKNHGLVCQRFVPEGGSLLTDFFAARSGA